MPRKKKKSFPVEPFDLGKVNPRGRVDVLAANALDRFTSRVPELEPLLAQNREVIHATLNESLGPHVTGELAELVLQAEPHFPLIKFFAGKVIEGYCKK